MMSYWPRVRLILSTLLLLTVFGSSSYASANSASSVIHIGGDQNYPPYEFLDESGQPTGYNTEMTLAIAEVMGLNVSIELGKWSDMRQQFDGGDIQVLQGMVHTAGRALKYSFSPPHSIIHQSIFARRGEPAVEEVSELKGKQVILQKGGSMHDYLVHNNIGADLIFTTTHTEALTLLASGKHDYALVNNLPGLYFGRELQLDNIVPVGQPVTSQNYNYAVVKGNEALLAKFTEGLAILKQNGRQQEIYDKWLGTLEESVSPWRQIGLIAGVASALLVVALGVIVIWNRALQRQVRRRTEELQMQQQQLIQADKMASLGVLVSGVAHEINNPSSLLLLNLPLLRDAFDDMEEILQAHYERHGDFDIAGLPYSRMRDEMPQLLKDMHDGSMRIQHIVDDLRDFARQKPADEMQSTDLNEVVNRAIRLTDNTIRKSTNDFQVDLGEGLPLFQGHPQRLEQVIINLIVNACQALENINEMIFIKTRYRSRKGYLMLQVIDSGCGIDADNLDRVNEPFFTTKREHGGTGLGLSISTTIVGEHGGDMQFESVGKGTKVTITLPLSK